MSVIEMDMLYWIHGNIMRDKVKNKDILTQVG